MSIQVRLYFYTYKIIDIMGNSSKSIGSQQDISQSQAEEKDSNIDIKQLIRKKIQQRYKKPEQSQTYINLFNQAIQDTFKNRALGCLFGSFIGDALGAYCEFASPINQKIIEKVMQMPGGGTYSLLPGQFTDDSQMASHLLCGLLIFRPQVQLKKQIWDLTRNISLQYLDWLKREPFDIGLTCRKGILRLKQYKEQIKSRQKQNLASLFKKIFSEVLEDNKQSQSNGSLMRIAPMGLFFTLLQEDPIDYKQLIQNQIKLIHAKPILQTAGYVWVNALFKVINRADNSPSTFKTIYKQLQTMQQSKMIEQWFNQSKKKSLMNGKTNIGWAKIAWTYGMQNLYKLGKSAQNVNQSQEFNQLYYINTIRSIISEEGDTDTNAAIVGGMIGAFVGFNNLPKRYLKKMIDLKFKENVILKQQARPSMYEPFQVLLRSLQLMKKCNKYKQLHKKNPS